jgi:norsolorinic acid ketoreductase
VVDTDMGKAGAAALGLTVQQFGGISSEDSAQGMLNVIDNATKETHGGKFWSYTGDELTY